MRELQLYGTLGCHLCEIAEQLLSQVVDFSRVRIELIDIAEGEQSARLMDRYAVRIPVLADPQSGEELAWPFTAEELGRFLRAPGAPRRFDPV